MHSKSLTRVNYVYHQDQGRQSIFKKEICTYCEKNWTKVEAPETKSEGCPLTLLANAI